MHTPDYEYYGLMAATWDLFRGDTSGWTDRFFYREMIARYGQPVLDVGCGTGRLLLDYLSTGTDIEGVDNSPEMLALCRQKAAQAGLQPTLYHQMMQTLQLPRLYRTVLVPSSSFQLLTDREQAQEAIRRFYAHLLPGGVLVMPFMRLWQEGDPLQTEWKLTAEKVRENDGTTLRRWSKMRFDPAESLEHTQDRYEVVQEGNVISEEHHERSPATRSYTQEQADALYAEAGFVSRQIYHEFTLEPAQPTDRIFTVVGKCP